MAIPRILYANNAALPTSALTASSEAASFEVAKLLDQARGRRWRSATGWTIVAGFNDEHLFRTDNGYRIAHVAPGYYATGATLATAIQAAMDVAGYNPLSNPGSLTPTAWWRADSVTLESDSGYLGVSQMTDLSGNGRHLTQANAALRPLWVAQAIGSRPGVYFDGTTGSQGLLSTAIMSALLGANGIGTVVLVFRLDSDAAAGATLWRSNTGGATGVVGMTYGAAAGTTFDAYAYDSALRTATKTAALGVSSWQHGFWQYDQTNLAAYVSDGDTAAGATTAMSGAVAAAVLASVFTLGGGFVGSTKMKGYILECMCFSNVLDESRRRGIVEYLRGRYPSMAANDTTAATGWGSNTNIVSYSSTTKKFSTGNNGAIYEIPALTGVPSAARIAAIYKDIGYTLTDKTGSTTYVAENASYQSRHWVKALLSAAAGLTAGVALDHNAAAAGTFTVEGNSNDVWLAPTLSQALSGDSSQRSAYFGAASHRWWRLVIDDVQNVAGYSELGIWYVGTYFQPPAWHTSWVPGYEDLSQESFALFGAGHLDERPQREVHQLMWPGISNANRALFVTFREATPVGRCFFFLFDINVPTGILYVTLASPIATPHGRKYWTVGMSLREALQ